MPGGLILLLGLVLFAGCASERTLESDLGLSDAPDWVNIGTQAVDNDGGRLLQGVGMAAPMNDPSLQRSIADNRARTEIARILSTYIDSTIKDYSAVSGTENRANVEQALHSSSRTALSGARIIARWLNQDNGNLYAFAELDMQQLETLLSTSSALSSELQKYIADNADKEFKQLMKGTQ
jgi:hypothetical protein